MKKLTLLVFIPILISCVADAGYRSTDPKTCITSTPLSNSCSEEEASLNRSKLFKQCKDLGGNPQLRLFHDKIILGINCLMPTGEIRDLYKEKFKQDTGKSLN